MKKRGGGSIVIVASVQGHACQVGVAAYAASKGGLHALTRAMAGITQRIAFALIPSARLHPTPIPLEHAARHFSPDLPVIPSSSVLVSPSRFGRVGTVEEVAELAAFLLSERCRLLHRWRYLVDGGLLPASVSDDRRSDLYCHR